MLEQGDHQEEPFDELRWFDKIKVTNRLNWLGSRAFTLQLSRCGLDPRGR